MTSVVSAIASLLYDHDTVIVPGLGAFVRHDRSAHVNVITNEFERPSSQIGFDPRQREENTLVGDFLVASDGLTNDEARTAIATYVSECFATLKEEGRMALPGIGTLVMDERNDLTFEPDESNFNADAFGLEDLEATPVYGVKEENVSEPVFEATKLDLASGETVSPSPGSLSSPSLRAERSEAKQPDLNWLWLLLLLLVAAGVALWYFKFRPVPTKPWPLRPVPAMQPRERMMPRGEVVETPETTEVTETPETPEIPEITPDVTPEVVPEVVPEVTPSVTPEAPAPVQVVKPEPTSKAFIVGGCFEIEKNALNMTVEAREQGCAEAFVMKRGSRYFVCYGQYPTTAEAKAALPEVLKNYNSKAWILTK